MRLIDADKLSEAMYHAAFEEDSDDQRWDSGCWIKYKMFERVLDSIPTQETAIVRCKDCKNYRNGKCDFLSAFIWEDFYCEEGEKRNE